MNKHLAMVREFHAAYQVPQPEFGQIEQLSDMDIIFGQALLMEEASRLFYAFKDGELADILAGLVNLGYAALTVIALEGKDAGKTEISWPHDGRVISIMQRVTEQIKQCAAGKHSAYSDMYGLSAQLARDFLNADFDKAFQAVHDSRMKTLAQREQDVGPMTFITPDLSDSLFE